MKNIILSFALLFTLNVSANSLDAKVPELLKEVTEGMKVAGSPPAADCCTKKSFPKNYALCVNKSKTYERKPDGTYHNGLDNGIARFYCTYECQGKEKVEMVKSEIIERKFIPGHPVEEALNPVCPHVQMKKNKWGYDAILDPFYAHDTQVQAVKKWASLNVERDNPIEHQYLVNLKSESKKVTDSILKNPGMMEGMRLAAMDIEKMAKGLPEDTRELDKIIKKMKAKKAEEYPLESKERWLYAWMRGLARFRMSE
ncbi:MAG: hypothetical protein ACLGHN_14175 [Bacteriovoracia bacterium]